MDDPGSLTERQREEDSHDLGLTIEYADRHSTPKQTAHWFLKVLVPLEFMLMPQSGQFIPTLSCRLSG